MIMYAGGNEMITARHGCDASAQASGGIGRGMLDKTTEGFHADPVQVEALLRSQCGYHLAEADPLSRYLDLTQAQILYEALVAAIRSERGRALAELVQAGAAIQEVAKVTRLGSRQRVQALIARAAT